MRYFTTCLFLLVSTFLVADVQTLSFEDLAHLDRTAWQAQPIQIRGFLYQTPEAMILTDQPNLKSCCVSTKSKIEKQIIVRGLGLTNPTLHVLTLEGVLKVDPIYDDSGKPMRLFVLDNSQLVEKQQNYLGLIIGGLILFLVIYIACKFKC